MPYSGSLRAKKNAINLMWSALHSLDENDNSFNKQTWPSLLHYGPTHALGWVQLGSPQRISTNWPHFPNFYYCSIFIPSQAKGMAIGCIENWTFCEIPEQVSTGCTPPLTNKNKFLWRGIRRGHLPPFAACDVGATLQKHAFAAPAHLRSCLLSSIPRQSLLKDKKIQVLHTWKYFIRKEVGLRHYMCRL